MKRMLRVLSIGLVLAPAWVFAADNDKDTQVIVKDEVIVRIEGLEGLDRLGDVHIDLSGLEHVVEDVMEAIGDAMEAVDDVMGDSLGAVIGASIHGHDAFLVARSESGEATEINETRKARPDGDIEIKNIAGTVVVIGWKKDEIKVEGLLGEDVEELEFEVSGGSAVIEVKVPRRIRRQKIRTELTIHVPQGSEVEVETVSASIDVSDLTGDSLNLESISGSVNVKKCQGEMEIESVSGSIEIEDADDTVEAESISGHIEVSGSPEEVYAGTVSGPIKIEDVSDVLEVESISGSVTLEGGDLEELDVETVSGSVRYRGGLAKDGEVEINTLSGSVRLHFDKEPNGEFYMRSLSGGIETDFGPGPKRSGRGPGKELRFTNGKGDVSIDVETFSGSIGIYSK